MVGRNDFVERHLQVNLQRGCKRLEHDVVLFDLEDFVTLEVQTDCLAAHVE